MDPTLNRTRSAPGRLELSVGPGGDLEGRDDKVLQAGADYLARLGGGVLRVLPATYRMTNALYLHPGLTLRGAGEATVLRKTASGCTPLIRDSDWYENRVTVEDPSPFRPGCGIMLRSYADGGGLREVVRDTVVDVDGSELTLSRRLLKNFWLEHRATAATLFPLVTAEEGVSDVTVEDVVLDGNLVENEEINGNYAGAVFIQQCHRWSFRGVTARGYHGDGFSFQVCDDVSFEDCRSLDNASLGFHPGSGSQRPLFRRCEARGNAQGIFFCWGVTDGRVEDCACGDNRDYGISIGHRDTDNRLTGTLFEGNHRVGLLFREADSGYRGGHRNVVEGCRFVDNGFADEGVAVDIRGDTRGTEIRDCRFEAGAAGRQRVGIRIGGEARGTRLSGNAFEGLVEDVTGGAAESGSGG